MGLRSMLVRRLVYTASLVASSIDPALAQLCPPGVPEALVGDLHWPSSGCAEATTLAEHDLTGFHYRNACKDLLGGDLPDAVLGVKILNCVDDGGAQISAAVCCDASYYSNEPCPYSMDAPCSGSGTLPAENAEKYEYYRRRLFCDFVYRCPDPSCQGCSLPANERGLWNGIEHSQDALLNWGDTTMSLGYLIAVLATEYRIRADGGADTSETVRDLYNAIATINRLDRNAETYFGGSPEVNGFFVRDDVPSTLIGATDPYFNSTGFSQLTVTRVRSGAGEGTPTEMTHDQVWPLFLGLALVSKLVPEQVSYQGTSLAREGREIVRRILLSIREYKSIPSPREVIYRINVPGKDLEFKASSGPWLIVNPVTGRCPKGIYEEATCDNAGAIVLWLSYGAAEAACKIVHGFTPGATTPLPDWCEFHDRHSLTTGLAVWRAVLGVRLNREEDFKFQILATVSDAWPHSKLVKRSTYHKYEILPLVNAVLYDRLPGVPRETYDCFLNTAPCRWPYNWGDGAYPHYDWSTTSRFFSLGDYPGSKDLHFDGEYNGLDYMLLHNLYRIAYGSVNRPGTADRCDCFALGKGKATRVCKKECRKIKGLCKSSCKDERKECIAGCPGKGSAKRKCKRECRKDKRACVRSCRGDKRECKRECRTVYRSCGP